ncbi:hypothetical protein IKP85_01830 [bacterium]|nr:hypothetical protein [bacterium]
MKNVYKIVFTFILVMLLAIPVCARVVFNVVVLPVDLFKVCANYYCYPEISEIVSTDVIDNFNSTGRINSPSLSYVRKAAAGNQELKTSINNVLMQYNKDKSIDFSALKYIAKSFNANSVLIISNDVPVENAYSRRSVWEMLVLSTNFKINYPYQMETDAVLVDTINDLVMWKNTYKKKISDSGDNFRAPNASDAYAKLEYFRLYSKDILAKSISQNIYLRFFPKIVDPQPIVRDTTPTGAYFRFESDSKVPALQNQLIQHQRDKYKTTTFDEEQDNSYGEMMYAY